LLSKYENSPHLPTGRWGLQTVDKTTGFRQSDESFRPPFSKGGAVEGAQPSSRSAEREILLRRFFLRTQTREAICGELASLFSFAPLSCKEKATMEFVQFDSLRLFSLQSRGASVLLAPSV
jgi:hypothetical protein